MVNVLVIIVSAASLVTLANAKIHVTKAAKAIKIGITVFIALGFLFYQVYQAKVYVRLYERLRIFNNRILEVYDAKTNVKFVERQHNLSSVMCVAQELASDSVF